MTLIMNTKLVLRDKWECQTHTEQQFLPTLGTKSRNLTCPIRAKTSQTIKMTSKRKKKESMMVLLT